MSSLRGSFISVNPFVVRKSLCLGLQVYSHQNFLRLDEHLKLWVILHITSASLTTEGSIDGLKISLKLWDLICITTDKGII